ncbi:DUF1206 domain-containing protein [Brevirhabdus sp.]|uniref:DUF1206 domain-containing protein n=1 Tax=Brevirhabdus sp. TaxID=2004514 RepID=UPI0040594B08
MSNNDNLAWTVPVMRAGYTGRGLVYLVVAGFSIFSVMRGGSGEGTGTALQSLENSPLGTLGLGLIFLGMLAYAVWRGFDAAYDLENYGQTAKGVTARTGMVVTGAIHLGIGFAALAVLFTSGGGDESSIARATAKVMSVPAGRWIVALAGVATFGAGLYYLRKAWKETYRDHLVANHFTAQWNPVLKFGVSAQGALIVLIGAFFIYAGFTAQPDNAGGVGKAFTFLAQQPFGKFLVGIICVGLLGFALFCFVNAAYRIVPKVAGDDIETLAARLKSKARRASASMG